MNILVIVLRILHVIAGMLWAGGAIHYFLFIEPTAKATAPESQKFMGYLMTRKKWTDFMGAMSLVTILAGAALYYRLGSVDWGWVTTGPGIGFTLGALAGIIVFAVGNLMIGPRIGRLGKLAQQIQVNGGAPSAEQAASLNKLQKELERIGKLDFALISIAMLTMSTARYWTF
jgi:uncharacterized membrane protein